jgi:ribosome-associated toxin RatA of RatAB toxin-antitoxin module
MKPSTLLARAPIVAAALALLVGSSREARAQATPGRDELRPMIHPIDPTELQQLRPMIPRGAVIVLRSVDVGPDPCCTVYVRADAPLDVVRRAIATPDEYPTFMPTLRSVQILAHRGSRTAFRFQMQAAVFDIAADASLQIVNDHRIDVSIAQSDIGPSSSRWELFPDGNGTIVAFTVWSNPTRSGWAISRAVGNSGFASAAVNIPVATALALGVRHRAEQLAGRIAPVRPSRFAVPPRQLAPPTPGRWLDMTRATNVVVLTLATDGALEQITVAGAAAERAPIELVRHMMRPERYGIGLPWMRDINVLSRSDDTVEFRLRLGPPLASSQGVIRGHREAGRDSVAFVGVSGDFLGEQHRWDFVPYYEGRGVFEMFTTGADERHVPWPQRAFLDVDPWASAGVIAYWNIVSIRSAFHGID